MPTSEHGICKERTSKIVDGHAWTEDDTELFAELSQEDQSKIVAWIKTGLVPGKTPLPGYTSYWLKHMLEHDTGIYTTNNQFKDAMLLCGFRPVDAASMNWNYRILKRSPALQRHTMRHPKSAYDPKEGTFRNV